MLLIVMLLSGWNLSACIEQTPLNLPTGDICAAPGTEDGVLADVSVDAAAPEDAAADIPKDTGGDTPRDTPQDTPQDTPPQDAPWETSQETTEDTEDTESEVVCQPDCDGKGCGVPDGCGWYCPGNCDPGWVCVPDIGDCFPEEECTVMVQGDYEEPSPAFQVSFPDAFLEAKVNAALSTVGQTVFTWDDVNDLEVLDAVHKSDEGSIGDLTGLQCLTGLKVLWLSDHGDGQPPGFALDLAPLAGLGGLTHLDLENDKVTDITPLKGLPSLAYLDLAENNLGDDAAAALADAAFAPGLLLLHLSGNELQLVPDLALYETIRVLDLADNLLSDLSPLGNAAFKDELVILHAEMNRSSAVPDTGIMNLAGLEGCFAGDAGPVPDALTAYVQDWRNKLFIWSNRVDSLAGLETMTGLQVLEASDNQISDLALMEGLGSLVVLGVSANNIVTLPPDIDTWGVVPPLLELDISWNPLVDHVLLGHFSNLQYLNVEMTGIEDLIFILAWQTLGPMPPITELNISVNPLIWPPDSSPLYPLAGLGATLEILVADEILSVTPAAGLTELWLPTEAFQVLMELRLGTNGLIPANLEALGQTSEEKWGTLLNLYLPNNEIASGLSQLIPLTTKATPLEILDLSGNTIDACQALTPDWDAVCSFETAVPTFFAPEGCDPCG